CRTVHPIGPMTRCATGHSHRNTNIPSVARFSVPNAIDLEVLKAGLVNALSEAKAPGAVAYVADRDRIHLHAAAGARQLIPQVLPAETGTIYDLASLTKVIATTTALLLLHESGDLDLDQPVGGIVPIPAFSAFTVRHCMTHTSGL